MLAKLYTRFPLFALNIAMLLSPILCFNKNKSLYSGKVTGSVIKNCINISTSQRSRRGFVEMKQKIDKVNGIRAALLKRGEAELIDPYKLMAFSDACLDDCITKMKYATPKYPYRYFLKCAFDYCKWNNPEPD